MSNKCGNTLEVLYAFSMSLVLTTLIFLPLTGKDELIASAEVNDVYYCLKEFSNIEHTQLINFTTEKEEEIDVFTIEEKEKYIPPEIIIKKPRNLRNHQLSGLTNFKNIYREEFLRGRLLFFSGLLIYKNRINIKIEME